MSLPKGPGPSGSQQLGQRFLHHGAQLLRGRGWVVEIFALTRMDYFGKKVLDLVRGGVVVLRSVAWMPSCGSGECWMSLVRGW